MSRAGFLDRWAARKAAARGEASPEPPQDPAAPEAASPPQDDLPRLSEAEAEGLSDAEALERLALPDPGTLGHGADFSAFLRAGVPRRLQRLALRRLWRVSPEQAALDGLVDYAEDYTDAAVAMGAVSTTYEVGKGLRAHSEALARQQADRDAAAAQPQGAPDGEARDEGAAENAGADEKTVADAGPADDDAQSSQIETTETAEEPVPVVAQHHEDGAAASRRTPRRMVFRFDET